jgi:hypothetical protein
MGADLDLQVNKDYCRVRDVSGNSFVVSANGSERSISMEKDKISIRVLQSLKLTDTSATIADLKSDRVYTPANDPYKKFNREQPGWAGDAGVASLEGTALVLENAAGAAQTPGASPGAVNGAQMQALNARNAANNAGFGMRSEFNNAGGYAQRLQRDLAMELFDAMEVTFQVSSEKPLESPYVVIIARYHEKDSQPGRSKLWIFAKALAPINSKPRKINMTQGGFPPGFVMEDFKVHLYDRSQELATNVVDKRVDLTYSEAFKYVLIDYISGHKGASLPPAPVMGKLPAGWHTRMTADQLSQQYFVRVSKDGMPLGAYADEACMLPVTDPNLVSIVKEIRFTPALEKGKAVDGTAKLRLGDIRI